MRPCAKVAVAVVALLVVADAAAETKKRRAPRERRNPASSRRERKSPEARLEKYDRLLEMAASADADTEDLKSAIEELRQRESALLASDDGLVPPRCVLARARARPGACSTPRLVRRPPRVEGFNDPDHELEEGFPEDLLMEEMLPPKKYTKDGPKKPPMDRAEREAMMQESRERLERLRDMSPEERIEEMRRDRDERMKVQAEEWGEEDAEERQRAIERRGRASRLGDAAKEQFMQLSPEERHARPPRPSRRWTSRRSRAPADQAHGAPDEHGSPSRGNGGLAREARRPHGGAPRHHGRLPRALQFGPRGGLREPPPVRSTSRARRIKVPRDCVSPGRLVGSSRARRTRRCATT